MYNARNCLASLRGGCTNKQHKVRHFDASYKVTSLLHSLSLQALKNEQLKVNSRFEGTFTLLTAGKEVTIVLLESLQLHQLSLFLLLLLLPLKPQSEALLRVNRVSLHEKNIHYYIENEG